MSDKQLWEKAQKKAQKEYEKHYGDWKDADKYERQDLVFSEYIKLRDKQK